MKRAAEFCQFEKIERFVPFQHERPNIYGYVEERMLYSLIYFLWSPDVPVSFCKVKCVDRQDDSTDHEKHVCSGRGFQLTCLLCIYIAVGMP